jgi:hypothetical protein
MGADRCSAGASECPELSGCQTPTNANVWCNNGPDKFCYSTFEVPGMNKEKHCKETMDVAYCVFASIATFGHVNRELGWSCTSGHVKHCSSGVCNHPKSLHDCKESCDADNCDFGLAD